MRRDLVTPRCFVKADTLPVEMVAELTKAHGKARDRIAEPELKALTKSLNTLSTSVQDANLQGSRIEDEELCDLLAGLDLIPGKGADAEATNAIRVWATIEDDDGVVKAMREDAAEEMAAALAGTLSLSDSEEEAKGEEEEKEDGGDERAERGRDAPPAYAELSAHFGVLESAAEKSGNADAAHYLSKARMAMILAHAARRTRQADMREFIATE